MKISAYYIMFILIVTSSLYAQFDIFQPKTTIGGYGELHYNYNKSENSKAEKTLDFHRFVMFYSHAWSEKWSFKAELELEHNFVSEGQGELELEQAYIDYRHSGQFGLQVGVILPSAGLLNEIHEPPTFLSVERPDYHKNIIPTTWFGNGLSIYGVLKDIDYKVTVMEGLDASKFTMNSGIRGGRQKGFKSDAENLLYNARVNFTGINGLLAGASFTYNNAGKDSSNISITLFEIHLRYRANSIYFDAEYGNITYGNRDVERSTGYYIDLGYNIGSVLNIETELIPFVRYTDLNTVASTKTGGEIEKQYHNSKWMIGFAVKPIHEVVFKVDYSENENALSGMKTTYLNFGAGYMF
ncbi:MAG: hypothetical protein JW995_03985 [Melioribacteraceae bacterium]|nr:hypothetical protein [Melioribacteraceae bacterium]